ncbi:MAG: transposase [Nitrosomonas sp.]|nr:transposase [Nitrosomonas sp.]
MQTFPNIGVDVAKDAVVVACAAQSFSTHSVTNQRTPLLAWLKSLPTGSRIGLESTGGYHELLADLAHAQGHVVFLLNPLDTKHYARAMGNRAKTDRVDTELKAVSNKLDALIAKIDSTMTAIAAHSPQHKEAQQRLQTIAGVGPVVGMALTNTLERVPFRNADAFVAFTGSTREPTTPAIR